MMTRAGTGVRTLPSILRQALSPPPTVSTVTTPFTNNNGTEVILIFNEGLDTGSVPLPGAFKVVVDGSTRTVHPVTGVRIGTLASRDYRAVYLTLQTPVLKDDNVRVSYTVPANVWLRDTSGNAAAAISDYSVTNATRHATAGTGALGITMEGAPAYITGTTAFTVKLRFSTTATCGGGQRPASWKYRASPTSSAPWAPRPR